MTHLPPAHPPESGAWRTDPEEHRADREAGTEFLDGWRQEPGGGSGLPTAREMVLTSASVTVVAVLGCIAFVSGALWASLHEPDLDYGNIAGEIGIKVGYALFVGALTAAVVLALATAVAGFFVLRHRKRTLAGTAAGAAGAPRPVEQAEPPANRRERTH